jgi:polyisoprenoid-binding protein YceI
MRRRRLSVIVGLLGLLASGWLALAQTPPAALRYVVVAERSEVRYRVREQLVAFNFPNDAVGSTSAVDGQVVLDGQGRVLPGESRFTVDVRTLRSDAERRDNYIRRRTLETERYPAVVLVPVELRGLTGPLPSAGSASFELVGDLTVRDVTRRTTWQATASFSGPEFTLQAWTAFRFEDVRLQIPRVAVVLSVEDNIRLEADLVLRRSS